MHNIERYFFHGFIRLHILYHASQAPVYGLEMIEELDRHGYRLSPGTMYPLLHNMERAGYLESVHTVHNGRTRKYYSITVRGNQVLETARRKIHELVKEVSIAV